MHESNMEITALYSPYSVAIIWLFGNKVYIKRDDVLHTLPKVMFGRRSKIKSVENLQYKVRLGLGLVTLVYR